MSIVVFLGETIWGSLVNHYGLDITDEDEFLTHCKAQKAVNVHSDKYQDLDVLVSIDELERLYCEWER